MEDMVIQVWTNSNIGGKPDQHDYDIVSKEDSIVLCTSKNLHWTKPGAIVGKLTDTGEAINIILNSSRIVLNYCEVTELMAMLLLVFKDRIELRESKIIKCI